MNDNMKNLVIGCYVVLNFYKNLMDFKEETLHLLSAYL